jgi:hypothetical protein
MRKQKGIIADQKGYTVELKARGTGDCVGSTSFGPTNAWGTCDEPFPWVPATRTTGSSQKKKAATRSPPFVFFAM